MSPRTVFILVALAAIFVANLLMLNGFTNYKSNNYIEDFIEKFETTNEEGFIDLNAAAGYGDEYVPIGTYDGVKRVPEHGKSEWRGPAPDEPLIGPEVEVGQDNLFMFKNNQCKPECCGASFSCGSGCVCTTAKQRDMINSRGGNRTAPTDSV
jgi:hypothetical protein